MNDKELKLNQEQKRAVHYNKGPLLIVAGAGTGKTTVITEKIKWIISSGLAKTDEILALTFTDKAAREMEERVDVALPYGYTDIGIMTFHAFGDRILKDEALQIGLNPNYRLMTQAEAVQLLRRHLFDLRLNYFRPLGNPTKFISGLLHHFSRLKDEDITPQGYLVYAKNFEARLKTENLKTKANKIEMEKNWELARAYKRYEKIKEKEGLMDFGDLIGTVLRLFRERPNVLRQYRKQFKYILVDEFQDTNIAQYQLLKLLAPPRKNPNVSVVADDSQSVYKFRGAAVSNILHFKKDYPTAKSVVLIKNYRSTQRILDSAYRLIQYNNPDTLEVKLGISKNLRSTRGTGHRIEFIHCQSGDEEADVVAKTIKSQKLKIKNLHWRDFAILVRANNHAETFIRSLKYQGIPYQFLGPGMLFRQSEVKDLIAYLLLLNNLSDDAAFYRVLAMKIFGISGRDLAVLVNFARRFNLTFFEVLEMIGKKRPLAKGTRLPFLSQKTQQSLDKLTKMIYRHLELVKKEETAGQILYYFLKDSGMLLAMVKIDSLREQRQIQNIARFFDRLRQFEMDHEDASVSTAVDWITLSQELGESPLAAQIDWTAEDRVNILTVHSAKGLEFPIVFLVDLVSGRFPPYQRREQIPIPQALIKEILPQGDYHQEEERRLFYVGMTRAADRLFLTAADYYGAGKRARKTSPFVIEALGENQDLKVKDKPFDKQQSSILRFKPGRETPQPDKASRSLVTSFSFSQISAFEHCPAQYRYAYLQRIPSPPTGAQTFGVVIHKTLFDFYHALGKLSKKNPKKNQESSLEKLLFFYRQNWLPFGFSSRSHEQGLKKEGEKMLKRFHKDSFDINNLPSFLERKFNFFLTPQIKITGIFDRVDKKGQLYEIIDYKTGRVMEEKEVRKNLQMMVYALAAVDPGILGVKPKRLTCTFYFLSEGQQKSVKRTAEELVVAKKKLIKEIEKINQSDFSPQPGFWCNFCPYKIVCDAWK